MKSFLPWSSYTEKIVSFLSRLSKRERIFFIITGLIVVIFISDRLVIQPIFTAFRSLKLEVENLQTDVKKSVKLLSQKERILKEQKDYAVYSSANKSQEEQAVALLQHIEELANRAKVNLLYVKPATGKNEEAAKKSFVTLECEGRMEEIIRFFYEIENSTMLLEIEKYALRPTTQGSMVVKMAATISRPTLP